MKYFVGFKDGGEKFYTDPLGIMRIYSYGDCDDYGLDKPCICESYDLSSVTYSIPSSVSENTFRRAVAHILYDLHNPHLDWDE